MVGQRKDPLRPLTRDERARLEQACRARSEPAAQVVARFNRSGLRALEERILREVRRPPRAPTPSGVSCPGPGSTGARIAVGARPGRRCARAGR